MVASSMSPSRDEYWMRYALALAKSAQEKQEVPVGAVLVLNDQVIGEGYNQPISTNDPTAHAEVIALRQGGASVGNYRLVESELYVTLEPCIMCVGALVHARVKRLIFGAEDLKAGAVINQLQLATINFLNHQPATCGGILKEECGELLSKFFKARRKKQ